MSIDERIADALDAAAGMHDAPDGFFERITREIEARRARRRRVTLLAVSVAALSAAAITAFIVVDDDTSRVSLVPVDTKPTTTAAPITTAAPTTTEAPTPTTTAPAPVPPATFVGVQQSGRLVLGEARTGKVVRTLYTPPEGEYAGSAVQSSDGKTVYFVAGPFRQGRVMQASTAGGAPKKIADACLVGLSPDDKRLAIETCGGGISLLNAETGARERTIPNGDFTPRVSHLLPLDGKTVVFTAAGDELPPRVYRLDMDSDRTLADAELLGKRPAEEGPPWNVGGVQPGGTILRVLEWCCMVDAEPDPSRDMTDLVTVDIRTGAVLSRERLPEDTTELALDPTGTAELHVGIFGELFRREGGVMRRLAGEWRAVDW